MESAASFEELKQGFATLPFSLAKVPSISKLAADKAITDSLSVGRVSSPRLCPTFSFLLESDHESERTCFLGALPTSFVQILSKKWKVSC